MTRAKHRLWLYSQAGATLIEELLLLTLVALALIPPIYGFQAALEKPFTRVATAFEQGGGSVSTMDADNSKELTDEVQLTLDGDSSASAGGNAAN